MVVGQRDKGPIFGTVPPKAGRLVHVSMSWVSGDTHVMHTTQEIERAMPPVSLTFPTQPREIIILYDLVEGLVEQRLGSPCQMFWKVKGR